MNAADTLPYFDAHLHLPSADEAGLQRLLRHVAAEPAMTGGNLILNTAAEIAFACRHRERLPASLNLVPVFQEPLAWPAAVRRSGWYKVHPVLHRIDRDGVEAFVAAVSRQRAAIAGLIVHCFPWGRELAYRSSLHLLLALAEALPETPLLCAHGGGYESWEFRAHAFSYRNVYFDFSATLQQFADTCFVQPLAVYLRKAPERVLFGSDWPSAEGAPQLAVYRRMAAEAGLDEAQVGAVLSGNARRWWPPDPGGHA